MRVLRDGGLRIPVPVFKNNIYQLTLSKHKTRPTLNNSASDTIIIKKILEGDKASFRILYERHNRSFLLICLRYFKNRADSEDMMQESFLKIYKQLKQFDPERGKFVHWSKRIVINTCLEKLRKKNVLNDFDSIFDMGINLNIPANALDNLSLEELTYVIQQLPKGYRTIFNLYVIDGYNHREIGEMLNISENTSKTQLMKARKFLQKNINRSTYNMQSYA